MGDWLGAWERCSICGEHDFARRHRCSPLWQARRADDTDEEWEQVRAKSAEDAAEVFALKTGRWAEYGEVVASQVILVRALGDDVRFAFQVEGEAQPVYVARQIPLPATEEPVLCPEE